MDLRRKAVRLFTRYRWWQMLLAPLVFLGLGLARLMILTLPFKRYQWVLGRKTSTIGDTLGDAATADRARQIGRIVRATAQVTPWTSNCLPQAMVAAWLLRRGSVPYALHLGVKKGTDDPLEAHAWIMSAGVGVTGLRESIGMTPVATYI